MLNHIASAMGTVTATALMLYGVYATAATRFLSVRAFPAMLRQLKSPQKTERVISPFRAFATSLAGTIGVGNLTGVSLAIASGGAGAVFWMWVSALVCMTVKYFEVFLAVKHQPKDETHYGFAPMEYLRKVTESKGAPRIFAFLGVCSALFMGSMIQTNAAANASTQTFEISPWFVGILFTAGAGIFLTGGIRRIAAAMEKAVPILGGIFLLLGITIILFRHDRILPAFQRIFKSAFSVSSAAGGLFGSGMAVAFRHGVGNGLFSHEAGLGSAGLAHGACGADPKRQGLWGMFEVFADTVVFSTVSALMILTADVSGDSGGVLRAADAVLGFFGESALCICLILFAFLSVLSWSSYGETCFVWLFGRSAIPVYRILFAATPLLAICLPEAALWQGAEIINGGMMILNLTGLLGYGKELKSLKT